MACWRYSLNLTGLYVSDEKRARRYSSWASGLTEWRGEESLFTGRELHPDLSRNGLRHLVLECQRVACLALIIAGPQMMVARTVNQLYSDQHVPARALNRTLHEVVHM